MKKKKKYRTKTTNEGLSTATKNPENKSEPSVNKKLFVLVLGLIVLLCTIVEIFVFHAWYFKLPASLKGKFNVDLNKISCESAQIKGDVYYINKSAKLVVKDPAYIARLEVVPAGQSPNIVIKPIKSDRADQQKDYTASTQVKKNSVIPIYENSAQAVFQVTVEAGHPVSIQSLTVLNTFNFNVWRFLFLLCIGAFLCCMVFFHRYLADHLAIAFVIIALGFGTCSALFTPLYYAFDEREHFIKSYQISSLDFTGKTSKPIAWPNNIDSFLRFSGNILSFDNGDEKSQLINNFLSNDYSHHAFYHTTAVSYTPIPYLPSALGLLVGKLIRLPFILNFYLGRLFSLFAYVALGYLLLKYTVHLKRMVFALLLLPALFYSVCAYSADGMNYFFAIAVVAQYFDMLAAENHAIGKEQVRYYIISGSLLCLAKIAYAPLSLLILSVPSKKFKRFGKAQYNKYLSFFICGFFAVITLLWATSSSLNQWSIENVNPKQQLDFIMNHLFLYAAIVIKHFINFAQEMFTSCTVFLAYSGTLPLIFEYVCIIGLFFLAICDIGKHGILAFNAKRKLFLLLTICLSWGAVVTALYLSFTPVGSSEILGVQGRYFAPLLLPSLLLLTNKSVIHTFNEKRLNLVLIWASGGLLALMNALLLYKYNF